MDPGELKPLVKRVNPAGVESPARPRRRRPSGGGGGGPRRRRPPEPREAAAIEAGRRGATRARGGPIWASRAAAAARWRRHVAAADWRWRPADVVRRGSDTSGSRRIWSLGFWGEEEMWISEGVFKWW